MNKRIWMLTTLFLSVCSQAALSQYIIMKPKEIDDVLFNPGIGFTTHQNFNEDLLRRQNEWDGKRIENLLLPNGNMKYIKYPLSTIAYFRWYWDEIEPVQGKYNWDLIDRTIAKAKENGQKLALRIMPQNGVPKAPEWYRQLAPGLTYENGKGWTPDYESPLFMEHYGNLVKALGERYDGHPDIDHVDIGILGRWGEWHTSQTGNPMPSMETQISFVDLYLETFPQSLLVMLIGGGESLAHAIQNGAGWRADCLGDVGGFSENWNHMEDMYPIALAEADAYETWRDAPVVFESCWTMQHWVDQGWDVKAILDRALQYHTSVFNNKSSTVPEEHWEDVNNFLRKLGYRFVLRRLRVPNNLQPGQTFTMQTLWENVGVAPIYQPYTLTYRLERENQVLEHTSEVNLRDWLPGYHLIEEQIELPKDIEPGDYTLRVALLDPQTKDPAVQFAIEGKEDDGWYRLGSFRIR